MPDRALLRIVAERLDRQPPPDGAAELILAAFQGAEAVGHSLDGSATANAAVRARQAAPPPAVHITELEVEGFRGIGPTATLRLTPGPGLTLVVGRNGSGKSSFSEALEMLLLGTNSRWSDRPKVWGDGWRNLHHAGTTISARFTVDGRRQPLTLTRRWRDDAPLELSAFSVDGRAATLDSIGWREPLAAYPPLLSHHDLERALDSGPSELYDALAAILGLGDLTAAMNVLRDARLHLDRQAKIAKDSLTQHLRPLLERTDDERARTVLQALGKKTWDLGAVQRVVSGSAIAGEDSVLRRLRDLSTLPVLTTESVQQAVHDLRAAHQALEQQRATDAGRALELAQLLEDALRVHAHAEDQQCPVCGTDGVITYEWRLQTLSRVEQLRTEAEVANVAHRALQTAMTAARRLVTPPPAVLRQQGDAPIDVAPLLRTWQEWSDAPQSNDALVLALHVETHGPELIAAVAGLRGAAAAELARREKSWLPAAQAVTQWLPLGLAAHAADANGRRLKAAEQWLRDAHDELRDERFKPIAGAVQQHWTELRQDSNVTLGELKLKGTGNRRQLDIPATVDGTGAPALGVMSQGELNCLALSLFLPRASLPESPFRFLVIDDPVQAMDPAKVEGLARALHQTARERQVIVLTHDTRLPDAVRYLGIPATVIEVVRRENSAVELRPVADPVRRYLEDAFAVAMTDELPPEAVRVVPGFCRFALEAASADVVTRRMLRDGRPFSEVNEELRKPTTLMTWLALGLMGDVARAGDVTQFLQRQYPWAVDAVHQCNRGTHSGLVAGDLITFARTIERLTKEMTAREHAHA